MKRIFDVFVLKAMVCGSVACSNSKAPAAEQVENEPVETEEIADPSTIDLTVVTLGGTESDGFGRCLESGCYCKAFKGRWSDLSELWSCL